MSTADSWDLTVPDSDGELLAELRRHGVQAGQRLRVVALAVEVPEAGAGSGQGRFGFAGQIKDGPADLASNTDHYLAGGFGQS